MEKELEAILFYKNEPVDIKKLASLLNTEEKRIIEDLKNLSLSLENRGVCLIMNEKQASLATSKDMINLIEKIAKEEMNKEIGKAGLETLSIILYNKEGLSRKKIDYIRGVNSTFILRNLQIRGLIEKTIDKDQKVFLYKPTLSLLAHIGVNEISQIPHFTEIERELENVKEKENL